MMSFFKSWNANLAELVSGASVNFCAKVLATFLGLVSSLLLSRYYGAETVGKIATVLSIVNIGTIFALCGFGTLTLKLIPTSIKNFGVLHSLNLYFKLLLIIVSHTIVIFLALSFLLALTPLNENLNLPVSPWLPGIVIIFTALLVVSRNTLRGLGDYLKFSLLDFLASGFVIIIVLLSIWQKIPGDTVVNIYFLAYVMACILAFALVKKQFQTITAQQSKNIKKNEPLPTNATLYNQAWPMFGIAASQILILNIDILSIGYFSNQNNVGIYSIYVKLVSVTAFSTAAINSMFAPKVAVLFEQKKISELRKFVKQSTLLASISVITLAIFLLMVHQYILQFYGENFLHDLTTLYILLASTIIHACFGPVGFFLNMTGRQKPFLMIMIFACIVNFSLNTIMVPVFGMLGAAIATLITTILWNTIATIVIFRRDQFTLLPIPV